jgi:hypothetical protein
MMDEGENVRLDAPILFLESERLRLKSDWRELLVRKQLSEEEEIAKKEIEEDMAMFERAIEILREHISQSREGS